MTFYLLNCEKKLDELKMLTKTIMLKTLLLDLLETYVTFQSCWISSGAVISE
jgi:hypothetical protein